ncbi:Trans-cinnamate 4-monooxygenase [Glycine soja]
MCLVFPCDGRLNPLLGNSVEYLMSFSIGKCISSLELDRTGLSYRMSRHGVRDPAEGGYEIPTESKILVNAWWLANNPAHWKKPEKFRPERFLEEELHVEANGNDFRYLPFGVGRRSCPGIILALPILAITLGRLVQNFELLPPPGQSQIDTSEKGGQFSLHILKHSTIVAKPRSF